MTTIYIAAHEAFNPTFHAFMIGEGATHERVPEYWEEAGDPENGPELDGCPAHDLYVLDDVEYVVFEDGSTDRGPAPPPMTIGEQQAWDNTGWDN